MSHGDTAPEAKSAWARAAPIAFIVTGAWLLAASRGLVWQDEYAHLLFSKWLWTHPELAIDVWGRPLTTLAYAPAVLLGLNAARVLTLGLAILAALWTARAATARGIPKHVAWATAAAQPIFLQFSFGAIPGILFSAVLARLLMEESRGRERHAAVMAAALPLVRTEGALISLIYSIALFRRGKRRDALIPFTGLIAWNLIGWAVTGSFFYLRTHNPYPLIGSPYPTAGWGFAGRIAPAAIGMVVFFLAQVGFVAAWRKAGIVHAAIAAVAVFLAATWGIPLFASTATGVYLIGYAPLFAILAAEGFLWVRSHPSAGRKLAVLAAAEAFLLIPRRRLLGAQVRSLAADFVDFVDVAEHSRAIVVASFALASAILVATLFFFAKRPRLLAAGLVLAGASQIAVVAAEPIPLRAHERVSLEAARWHREHMPERRLLTMAADLAWFAGADPFINWEPGSFSKDFDALDRLGPETVLAWDATYGVTQLDRSLASLRSSGWRDIAHFADGPSEIWFLERRPVSKPSP